MIVASIVNGELVWAISDTANGLMALPNLVGLVIMCVLVVKITKNYFDRKKGKDVTPMLSAYPEQNEEFIRELAVKNGEVEKVVAEEAEAAEVAVAEAETAEAAETPADNA